MTDILLALHFLGLMLGAGGGFGSMIVMRTAATLPAEQGAALRIPGPTLARVAGAGLVLMWTTGLALVPLRYGGYDALPTMFWVKMLFVATLTLAAILTELTYARVKRGDAGAAQRLAVFGPVAGASSLLAVLFAALTFH